jgi:hypothetical protein
MDMTISIPDDLVPKLEERAAGSGKNVADYAAQVVAETVKKPTIDEILAPVREDFAKTQTSDDQLLDFGREVLAAVRRDKKGKPE